MSFVRSALLSAAVVGLVMSGEGLAQTPAPDSSKDTSLKAKVETKAEDVAKWTNKEWNKAKDQKLSGRKSWSFLASCMTSST